MFDVAYVQSQVTMHVAVLELLDTMLIPSTQSGPLRTELLNELAQLRDVKIETFTGQNVYLDLWVKVVPNWRRSTAALERFGYHMGKEDRK